MVADTLDKVLTRIETTLTSQPAIKVVVFLRGILDIMNEANELFESTDNLEKSTKKLIIPFIIDLNGLESMCFHANAKLIVFALQH